jgi:predicted AlkP superfamily pyrophosphatase or phosphodiesterase
VKLSSAFIFLSAVLTFSSCTSPSKTADGELVRELEFQTPSENSAEALTKPVTVVLSIDGYRWDYNSLFNPPNLMNVERAGVAAKSLKPSYPSKTFPNHYTLVTGVKPPKHGIVSNEFYDPNRKLSYAIDDRNAVEDGQWYLAEPIWITAQKSGVRTASFFWVGSEAAIQGQSPNYFYRYSQEVPNAKRVDRVLEWLKLDEKVKPHLILMYFSTVDTAGHKFGTNSTELKDAVLAVDAQIGRLREGIRSLNQPVNLIIVSDHGMQDLDPAKTILIDESKAVADLLPKFILKGRGPQMLLYLKEGESPTVKTAMRNALNDYARASKKPFRVLMTQKELKRLNFDGSPRVGDLVLEPDLPWAIGVKAEAPSTKGANHGWDPKSLTMHGIFYAEGPSFREHAILPTVENVNVAPLILRTIGVQSPKGIDGSADVMKDILSLRK